MRATEPAPLSCAVFGSGALGLGFLGPELAPCCRVSFVDIPAKADLIARLHGQGAYVVNHTGLSMRAVRVRSVDALCVDDRRAVQGLLDSADLAFTAVGEANLPKLVPLLAEAAARRSPRRPLRVLCSENGVEVARNLRAAVEREAGRGLDERLLVGDTVMGRMCKLVDHPPPPVQPVAPGLDWAVVAEPFFGIPVEEHAVAGLGGLPAAVEPQAPAPFRASEDVKMLAHNGLHAVLACIGRLRGRAHFDELRADGEAMEMGRSLLMDEAGPALMRKHGSALGRSEYLNYCDSILRRVTCPVFHDPVARGVRGIMRKLEPRERLVYSLRTVADQGIEPRVYAGGVAAAVLVAQRTGETDMEFREFLTAHCGFVPSRDGPLLSLIESRRDWLNAFTSRGDGSGHCDGPGPPGGTPRSDSNGSSRVP
jgi:mannitol-1-phosphate/altronate dehydrogenase